MRISARRAPPVAHAYLEWAAPSCKAYPSVALVTDAEAATIRVFYEQRGEFAAAVELRRLFPAVTVNAQAQECARAIGGGSGNRQRPPRSQPRWRYTASSSLAGVRERPTHDRPAAPVVNPDKPAEAQADAGARQLAYDQQAKDAGHG